MPSAASSSRSRPRAARSLQQLYEVTRDLAKEGNARPDLRGLFSGFTANDPQFLVTIDREKTKRLQVPLGQITDTLQIFMGSAYVNDFDFNNRSYRVYVQADRQFRSKPQDIGQFYVRSGRGAMVPLENLVTVTETASAQIISHYNLFRSAEVNGIAAPGYSSGQAIAGHGGAGEEGAAGGIHLRLVRALAGGDRVGGPVAPALRAGPPRRVPDPGRAVRELRAPVHHPAGGADGAPGGLGGAGRSAGSTTTSTARSVW